MSNRLLRILTVKLYNLMVYKFSNNKEIIVATKKKFPYNTKSTLKLLVLKLGFLLMWWVLPTE